MATRKITDAQWNQYIEIVQDFIENDAGLAPITWRKHINQPGQYGEDSNNNFNDITLNVLIQYNKFRTWPVNKDSESGELDEQSVSIFVSARKLKELGYLKPSSPTDPKFYWDFNPGEDRFIINGITYKASGDTQVSQAYDTAILFLVVLKREELENY